MLFWFDDEKEVTGIGSRRRSFFEIGRNRLSKAGKLEEIKDFINAEIDKTIEESVDPEKICYVPGWKAPKDWTPLPLQAIYEIAYPGDAQMSALWYGLITMDVVIERDEKWYGMKTQFEGRDFEQAVYWLRR